MKTRYGFVILHYMAYDMTVHCADMLLENYGDKDIRIVIVDNASPNGSGKNLAAYYKEQTAVTVLFSRENVGFARGNNAGYSCLRDSCDYIIIMNNDVLIQQSDFLKKIHDLYLRERYAVLGPDIYSPHGIRKHQNPFFLQTSSKATLQKNLKAMEANNRRFHWFYMKTCMLNAVRRLPFAVYIFQFCKYRVFRHGGGVQRIYASTCQSCPSWSMLYFFQGFYQRTKLCFLSKDIFILRREHTSLSVHESRTETTVFAGNSSATS